MAKATTTMGTRRLARKGMICSQDVASLVMDGLLPLGICGAQGALPDVADGLFHLGRAIVGALLVVMVDEIKLGS